MADLFDIVVARKLSGGGGGGGSPDFSTAEVTIVNESPFSSITVSVAIYDETGTAFNTQFSASQSGTLPVILYNQAAYGWITGDFLEMTVSGNITKDTGGYFVVTGDGTITIS